MQTFHFDRSSLPSARAFYERELGELRRPDRKGWARPKRGCPFHDSKSKNSFFVNVDNGGFYCFGCDARGGDVLQFVRLRYRLSFPDALKHFHIELAPCQLNRTLTSVLNTPKPKPKEPPICLDQLLARKLAMAVEYGMEMPVDAE